MLDNEIYELLQSLKEEDIKVLVTMSVVYLSKVYNTNIRELFKDIKKLKRELR